MQAITHRGARFHGLNTDASRGEFIRQAPQHLCAVHVDSRRSGKIQHYQPGRRGFSADPIYNSVAHMIHVEIHQARLRPEDNYVGN